ncbi:MAG: hypothetical protein H0U70_02650 [Tatlockia sp.]|nr:hypothetical protein [Tatlockia sp.]
MAYDLGEVAIYAFKIAKEFKRIESNPFNSQMTWEEHKNVIKQSAENSKCSSTDDYTIGGYALALHNAAKFLNKNNNVKINFLIQQFIDVHLEGLKKAYQLVRPNSKIQEPLDKMVSKKSQEIMANDIKLIETYAKEIANEFSSDNLVFSQDEPLEILTAYRFSNQSLNSLEDKPWETYQNSLIDEASYFFLVKNRGILAKASLGLYALFLQNAAKFLLKAIPLELKQHYFIAQHLEGLEIAYRLISSKGIIKAPLLNSDSNKSSAGDVNKKPKILSESPQLNALITYHDLVLLKDKRSHSFFCCIDFSEERKAGVLRQFIQDFESSNNKLQFLTKFYKENGIKNSRYEILNTGQNITSRVFGIQTTTLDKIDALAQSIGFDTLKVDQLSVSGNTLGI